jgi:prepilin-type N-terminal cleavage/methylation domain-containing protein
LNAAGRQHGFSFVEIMVAVLLLAICAVPMGDAIRNGITASSIAGAKARELRCIKNTMETVLAEPYQSLYAAAGGKDQPATFPMPAVFAMPVDGSCDTPPRVSIARFELDYGSNVEVWLDNNPTASSAQLESPLLYITVAAANGGYSFTTLVAR